MHDMMRQELPGVRAMLVGMTIAVDRAVEMAEFYRLVLGAELRPVDFGGAAGYAGRLAGLELQICPKSLAGVTAAENVHQLNFAVADLIRAVAQALAAGGERLGETELVAGVLKAWIRDPDGNSIELVQSRGEVRVTGDG